MSRQSLKEKNALSKKNSLLAIISIFVVVIALVIMMFFALQNSVRDDGVIRSSIAYDYQVIDEIGVNIDTDALHFGGGPRGAIRQRSLNLTPHHDGTLLFSWVGDGNLSVSDNNFAVSSGEIVQVNFTLVIPENASYGNYSGTIYVDLHKD
ncbi:MAG: hypothetical protein ACOCU6_02800 [Nanoarchaeota archaeon]